MIPPFLHGPGRRPGVARPILTLLLGVAACGGNLTAGGLSETEVTVSGDAPDPPPASPTMVAAAPWAQSGDDDAEEAEGEIEAELLLFLERAGGGEVSLTPDEVRVRVDIRGAQEASAVVATVPAGRYTGLRVLFSEIEVEIEGGLVMDGQPLTGLVSVDLEVEGITVSRALDLDLSDGDRREVLLDLNTRSWLTAVDPTSHQVTAQAFADAIQVRVR